MIEQRRGRNWRLKKKKKLINYVWIEEVREIKERAKKDRKKERVSEWVSEAKRGKNLKGESEKTEVFWRRAREGQKGSRCPIYFSTLGLPFFQGIFVILLSPPSLLFTIPILPPPQPTTSIHSFLYFFISFLFLLSHFTSQIFFFFTIFKYYYNLI